MKKYKATSLEIAYDKGFGIDIKVYTCPRCKKFVTTDFEYYMPNYCSDCGQKLKEPKSENNFRYATKEEKESVNRYIESISKDTGEVF